MPEELDTRSLAPLGFFSSSGDLKLFFHLIDLIPPSLLPDKKMKFPQETEASCGICRLKPIEDIPEDIMDAVR